MSDKYPLKATVSIGKEAAPIEGYCFDIDTPSGPISIGVDASGNTYVSSGGVLTNLVVHPVASNKLYVQAVRDAPHPPVQP